MCAIFGSSSKERIKELAELNSTRGSHSWSITTYNSNTHRINAPRRELGKFDASVLDGYSDNTYFICHIQAPTTEEKTIASVHPVEDRGDYLWHNGIIKEDQVKIWQEAWDKDWKWDSKWILHQLNTADPCGYLSNIDGGFACVWSHQYSKTLRLFRNEFTPLFVGMNAFDISSTRADNMTPLKPNSIIELNFNNNTMSNIGSFRTKQNPYFFGVQQ